MGSFSLLLAQRYFVPSTAPLAGVCTVRAVGTMALPHGPEVLRFARRGETLEVVVRFWEGPGWVAWRWGAQPFTTEVKVGSLPADSLMPLADFSVPTLREEAPATHSKTLWGVWVVLAAVLMLLVVFPFLVRRWRPYARAFWLALRWRAFLYRWHPRRQRDLWAFAQALKKLLLPHADRHPGSLLPQEVAHLSAPLPLRQALQALLEAEQRLFLGQTLPPHEATELYARTWQALRACAPSLLPFPPRTLLLYAPAVGSP